MLKSTSTDTVNEVFSVVNSNPGRTSVEVFDIHRLQKRNLDFDGNITSFQKSLSDSSATWKVVVGLRKGDLEKTLRSLLEGYKVDAIVSWDNPPVKYFDTLDIGVNNFNV